MRKEDKDLKYKVKTLCESMDLQEINKNIDGIHNALVPISRDMFPNAAMYEYALSNQKSYRIRLRTLMLAKSRMEKMKYYRQKYPGASDGAIQMLVDF